MNTFFEVVVVLAAILVHLIVWGLVIAVLVMLPKIKDLANSVQDTIDDLKDKIDTV